MSLIPGQPDGQRPSPGYERLHLLGAAGAVAVLGSVAACGTVAGTASDTSAGTSPPAASAPAQVPPGQQTVTYIVTGSPADITYGPAGSHLTATVPMHVTARLGTPIYYAINAQLNGSGSVTCEILVDGKVIVRHAAAGSHNIAGCEIGPGPQTGQWRSDN